MNLLNVGIFGQSRGGFSGSVRWTTPTGGVNFYDRTTNTFPECCDPVQGGSIWSRTGYYLMNSPPYPFSQIRFCVEVENGSASSAWLPGGNLWPRFNGARDAMAAWQLQMNAIVWVQGEADATLDLPVGDYCNNIISIVTALRASGNNIPFFLCLTSHYRNGLENKNLYNPERMARWKWQRRVQAEQRSLILRTDLNIREGIWLDGCDDTYDGCHQGPDGQMAAALMAWEMFVNAHACGVIVGQTQLL